MISDATLEETLENAYNRFKLRGIAPLERCRLVAYDQSDENIYCSFEGKEHERIRDLIAKVPLISELLLEIRDEASTFEPIASGSIETKVYTVDIHSADIDGPVPVRVQKSITTGDYKKLLASKFGWSDKEIVAAVLKYSSHASLLEIDSLPLSQEDVVHKSKIFVANVVPADSVSTKFTKIVERFHLIISLHFVLPKTDKDTLEKLSIPLYVPASVSDPSSQSNSLCNGHAANGNSPLPKHVESADVVDAVMHSPPIVQCYDYKATNNSHSLEPESNSEDSSLSDGDRTLVGDVNVSPIVSAKNSPDQQLSSPDEPKTVNGVFYGDDDTDMIDDSKHRDLYFKVTYYEEPSTSESGEPTRILKVLVHKNTIIANLKRALEPYVKVPMEYFKIFRVISSQSETECTRLNEKISIFK